MMKRLWVLAAWGLCAAGVYAQAVDGGGTQTTADTAAGTAALQRQAEQQRINAERAALQKNVAQEEAACYQKFVVHSCLADIRAKRRTALADLKRQELLLNDAERKARAEAALQGVEDRKAAQAQKLQDTHNSPQTPPMAKAPRSAASAAADAARAQDADARRHAENAQKQAQHANKVAAEAAQQQRYEAKLQAAEKRQKNQAEKAAQGTKPVAQPLPLPAPGP